MAVSTEDIVSIEEKVSVPPGPRVAKGTAMYVIMGPPDDEDEEDDDGDDLAEDEDEDDEDA